MSWWSLASFLQLESEKHCLFFSFSCPQVIFCQELQFFGVSTVFWEWTGHWWRTGAKFSPAIRSSGFIRVRKQCKVWSSKFKHKLLKASAKKGDKTHWTRLFWWPVCYGWFSFTNSECLFVVFGLVSWTVVPVLVLWVSAISRSHLLKFSFIQVFVQMHWSFKFNGHSNWAKRQRKFVVT